MAIVLRQGLARNCDIGRGLLDDAPYPERSAIIIFRNKDRYQARMARIARWDRPLRGGFDRLHAWINMIFVDHGIFRVIYLNHHRVSDGFFRSAQPTPGQISRMAKRGIRTIVNLRGGREHGSWPLEKQAADAANIEIKDFILRSRGAPDKESLLALPAFFAALNQPVLVHCKSGADRAGLMAALYLLIHERRPAREAARQLSWHYGHFKFAKTGILDAFFEEFIKTGEERGIGFIDWVHDVYDAEALERSFKASPWSALLVDRILARE